jgi:hypothetical protein
MRKISLPVLGVGVTSMSFLFSNFVFSSYLSARRPQTISGNYNLEFPSKDGIRYVSQADLDVLHLLIAGWAILLLVYIVVFFVHLNKTKGETPR